MKTTREDLYTRIDFGGELGAHSAGDPGSIPVSGRPLEKGMAAHSRILAWRISRTESLGWHYSPWGCKGSDITEQLTNALVFNLP